MRNLLERLRGALGNSTFLKICAHIGGFIVLFFFFLYMTFPSEDLRVLVERSMSKSLGKPVSLESISLRGFSGVELGKTAFAMPARKISKDQKASEIPDINLALERLVVEGALLGLAQEQKGRLELELDAYDGSLKIDEIEVDEGKVQVTGLNIDNIDLRKSEAVRVFSPWDIRGVLNGRGKLSIDKKKLTSGALDIKISDAIVKKPVVASRAYGNFSFSDADLGTISFKVKAGSAEKMKGLKRRFPKKATVVVIKDFEISGADIMATLENEATIAWMRPSDPIGKGRISVHLALRLSDSYFDRKVKGKEGSEKPNAILRTFMKSDPRIRRATRNGWLGFRCSGTLAKPDCAPVLPSAKVARVKPFAPPSDNGDAKAKKADSKKLKKAAPKAKAGPKTKFKPTKLAPAKPKISEIPGAGKSSRARPAAKKDEDEDEDEDEEEDEEEDDEDEEDEDEEEDEEEDDEDDEDDDEDDDDEDDEEEDDEDEDEDDEDDEE